MKNMRNTKNIRKVICTILAFIMVFGSVVFASTENVEAAVTAKSLVASALKYMESYDTISYTYSWDYNIDDRVYHRTGMASSDSVIRHGYYIDSSQSEKGWEEYEKKDKTYRKGYSDSEWSINTDTTYDSKSISSYSEKKYIQYMLGHMKNMKITSKGVDSYTVTAVPDYSDTKIKKITLTIDKNKKCITKIKRTYKEYETTYLNSDNKATVKNSVLTWSNICYGKGNLKIPNGL